jgi:hypothetical protein
MDINVNVDLRLVILKLKMIQIVTPLVKDLNHVDCNTYAKLEARVAL